MNKKHNIILTGMPGAGKTYIGEKLAEKLSDFTFVDTDMLVEQKLNMPIVKVFQEKGEEFFRIIETEVIKDVLNNKNNQIISIGGGAFNKNNIEILKQNGVVFYLQAPINLLYERIKNEGKRPLLMNTDMKLKLSKLLNERESYYRQAHYTIVQENFETDEMVQFITDKYENLKDSIDILSYPVFVNTTDINSQKIQEYVKGKSLIVIDENVEKLYGKKLNFAPKFILKSGENQKNIKNYEKIIDFASKNNIERGDTLIAIGGGVTGDISGFAAATYLRGINLIHVPTTLLACVDSSIGGKTGINSDYGKNLIGAFYQPIAVFCNLNFLKTLDDKQFKTGLAEVLKYAFIEYSCKSAQGLFELLENSVQRVFNRDYQIIEEIIKICVEIKETVVKQDECENNLRQVLNFGHTYGHVLEKTSDYKISHGEAVAQGMVFAFKLALDRRMISKEYYERSMNLLKAYGLYSEPKKLSKKEIKVMEHDKKVHDGKVNFILPYFPKAVEIVKIEPKELL